MCHPSIISTKALKKILFYTDLSYCMISNINSIFLYVFLSLFICDVAYTNDLHKVQKGETVYQLSKKYGIPVEILLDVNSIADPSNIPTGYSLEIPSSNKEDSQSNPSTYVVQKGETLYSIAHKFNLTLPQIRVLNTNISDVIKIGQIIHVPSFDTDAQQGENNIRKNTSDIIAKSHTIKNTATLHSFPRLNSLAVLNTTQSFGKISENWPISGTGYILEGKLPGVLIEGSENQDVHSSSDGVVLYAALHTTFSNVVVIQGNDDIVYVYAGQKTLYIKQGDIVVKGTTIGILGIMPTLQKPILYFSLWNKNKFLDPRSKMG